MGAGLGGGADLGEAGTHRIGITHKGRIRPIRIAGAKHAAGSVLYGDQVRDPASRETS